MLQKNNKPYKQGRCKLYVIQHFGVSMRVSLFFIMLIVALPVFAGGSYFDAKIIGFTKNRNGSYLLSFYKLSDPYEFINNKELNESHVLIDYGCSQKLACFIKKRTFSEKQYAEAMSKLYDIAKPGVVIQLGIMSSGFVPIKGKDNYYRSYGAFYNGHMVYLYDNSHL